MKRVLTALFSLFAAAVLTAAESPRLASSVSSSGITWYFDRMYSVGRYVTGDWWVLGPVKIMHITPESVDFGMRGIINGSMIDPVPEDAQGYDSRLFGPGMDASYQPDLNAARPGGKNLSGSNPLVIIKPASLVSAMSWPDLPPGTANRVATLAILTVVDTIPPPDAFRPPYTRGSKAAGATLSQMRLDRLPSLPVPRQSAAVVLPLADSVTKRFSLPWIEHTSDWRKELFIPKNNMPNYGRDIAGVVSDAALLLLLDIPQAIKQKIAIGLVQYGIDSHALAGLKEGRTIWRADGGHMSGRLFPILFAGLMLDNPAMRSIAEKSGQYAYRNGHHEGSLPPDYLHFGELDQTFYVTARDVERTNGSNPALYGIWKPDVRNGSAEPYRTADQGLPEWGITHVHHPQADNRSWNAIYRDVCAVTWSGYLLASRILGIQNDWNHPPLFDYMDRYMTAMRNRDSRTWNDFQSAMWDTYRNRY